MTYKNSYQASEEEGQLLLESEQWTQEDAMDQAKVVSDNYRAQCARELDSDLSGDDEHATEELSYEEYHEKVDAIYEKTDWNAKGDEQKFPMTSVGAIFSLLASIFGVGILEQPKIMQQVGFLTGIIILLFSVWVSHMGGYYLGIAARMTGKKSLGEIAKTAGGVLGLILSVYSLLGLCILASIGYACSWWAYTSELYARMGLIDIETAQTSSGFASVRTLVISVMLVVLFPVCCQRDLSALATFSFGAAGVYVVLVFLMAYYWIADYLAADPMQWDADLRYKWTLGEHNSVPLVTPTGQGQSAFHSINLNANAGAGSLGKVWADANAERAAAKEPAAIASANEKVAAARNQVEGAVDVLNHPCHGMFGFEASWFFGGSFQALFMAVGLMNTAFACHFSCVDVFGKEMQKPTRKNINFVMGLSLAVTAVIYAGFMAMGWNYARKFQDISVTPVSEEISVNVGGATQKQTVATSYSGVCQQGAQDAILKNMKNPDDEFQPTLIAVAQFVVFLVLYLTYPLFISAARSTIHGLLWPDEKSGFLKHTAETGALCLITWLGAAVIPKVTIVLAFAGCGPGLALVLILPGYIMLCLNRSLPCSHKDRVIPWVLVIFGTILSLGGIILTVIYGAEWDRAANVDMSHEAVTYARQPPKLQITHAAPDAPSQVVSFFEMTSPAQGAPAPTGPQDSEKLRWFEWNKNGSREDPTAWTLTAEEVTRAEKVNRHKALAVAKSYFEAVKARDAAQTEVNAPGTDAAAKAKAEKKLVAAKMTVERSLAKAKQAVSVAERIYKQDIKELEEKARTAGAQGLSQEQTARLAQMKAFRTNFWDRETNGELHSLKTQVEAAARATPQQPQL